MMKFENIFLISLLILVVCCKKSENVTTIKGSIPNLPDGTMYLANLEGDRIDSAKTIKGVFTIIHKWNEKEPKYIKIDHIDKKGILRFFSFITNAKYKGARWATEAFLSDSLITMDGKLSYDTIIGIKLPPDRKPVKGPSLKAGQQTEAFYSIDGDLFDKIDGKMIQTVKEKINKYPYSYHLLYQINDNKNSFSPQQVDEFLKLFKGDITESESYKKLSAYNQKRFTVKNNDLPLIEDTNGKKSIILDPKYEKHLVVFWASWCGPCREEIPLLKEIYSQNNNIQFISISIDSDKNAWKKALNEEKMNWKQFVITERDKEYENLQMHFRLNGAIPYTVLVDNKMKILKSSVGLFSKKNLQDFIKTNN